MSTQDSTANSATVTSTVKTDTSDNNFKGLLYSGIAFATFSLICAIMYLRNPKSQIYPFFAKWTFIIAIFLFIVSYFIAPKTIVAPLSDLPAPAPEKSTPRIYTMFQDTDYSGQGDLKKVSGTATFCQTECDNTKNCTGYVTDGVDCYLKNNNAQVPSYKKGVNYFFTGKAPAGPAISDSVIGNSSNVIDVQDNSAPKITLSYLQNGSFLDIGGKIQNNGNTLLFDSLGELKFVNASGTTIWTAGTAGKGGIKLMLLTNNNLVLTDKDNISVWSSGTQGTGIGSASLKINVDGNLVLVDSSENILWKNGIISAPKSDPNLGGASANSSNLNNSNTGTASPPAIQNNTPPAKNTLSANEFLLVNDYLSIGDSKLILQGDSNLVLYKANKPLWASSTVGRGNTKLIMQADGNLVLYDGSGKATWAHGAPGLNKTILEADGSFYMINSSGYVNYIYKPASSTILDSSRPFLIKSTSKNLCVDIGGNNKNAYLNSCDPNNVNQKFYANGATIFAKQGYGSNMCLDDGGSAGNVGGTTSCDSQNQNQQFIYNTNGTISNINKPNTCWDDAGNVSKDRSKYVYSGACNGNENQKWTISYI